MERHLATVWESVADAVPEEIALVQGGIRRTYADFDDRAARLAAAFLAAGLGAGSKVALYLYNSPEYLETYFAGPGVNLPVGASDDWATVEADGTITLLGRGSQCINTGGEKVFAEEVEVTVKRHDGVDDCLVFGVADERFGQRVVGVVSLAPGAPATPAEIIAAAGTRLASYKIPRDLLVVETVPRTPNGKADYTTARELFEKTRTVPS